MRRDAGMRRQVTLPQIREPNRARVAPPEVVRFSCRLDRVRVESAAQTCWLPQDGLYLQQDYLL
jgi:hypothetical protein